MLKTLLQTLLQNRNGGTGMETEMQRVTIPGLDGTLWVTCFSLVLTLCCVVHGERQPCGYHVQGGSPNETGDAVMANVILALGWASVTIIHDSDAAGWESLEPELHAHALYTTVFHDADAFLNTSAFPRGRDGLEGGLVVLGAFHFVQRLFAQVAQVSNGTDTHMTVRSEWLTTLGEDDLLQFSHVAKPFENLAVVVVGRKTGLSLWTVLHVRDDSQLSFVSSLPPPPSSPLTRHRILPNPSYGFGGRTLWVVIKPWTFAASVSVVDGQEIYQGLVIEMLQELTRRLNFSYTLVPLTDDHWGQQLDNGRWDGPIGMLTRKEADLAAGAFQITARRSSVADPTTPYIHDNTVIVFRKGTVRATTDYWRFFLQPFHTLVYGVVAGCLVMVLLLLLLLLLLERGHWTLADGQRRARLLGKELTVLWMAVEDFGILLAGLVSRSHEREVASRPGRVLVMTWLLMCVVLTSLYSSGLTSSLTVGQQALPFTTLAQLVSQKTYTWGVVRGTAPETMLMTSKIKVIQTFYEKILAFAENDPDVLSADTEVHKTKVIHENYATVASKLGSMTWLNEFCDLAILPETLTAAPIGFYLQKDSPYTRRISEEISLMVDSGLIDYWRRKWSPEKQQCEPDKGQNGRVIGLSDTQTAFYLAVLGLGLAGLVLGVERLILSVNRHR